jgi:hypothetical protein
MKGLKGQLVEKIFINTTNGGQFLWIQTKKKDFFYEAYGDCCSESWFADMIGIDFLLNEVVRKVEEIDIEDTCNVDDGRARQEVDQVYCWRLTTKKGTTDIIFRNSSNGYYGGSCIEMDISNDLIGVEWKEITADWSA